MSKGKKARFHQLALGEEHRLTAGHAHHRAPSWSRDGKLLVFSVGGAHDASWVVVDRRGRVARALEGPAAGAASFSPDGSLAFERRFGATSEIWLTPGGDAPPVRLLGGDGRLYRDPVFSPDGAQLACAVAEDPDGTTRLQILTLHSGGRAALPVAQGRADSHPAFTPDGQELVFEGRTGEDHAIYALHLVTNELARLTPGGERARRPAVIDADLIVYEREPELGPSSLVLLDRKRGRAQVIIEDSASRCQPACFADEDGKIKIAYAAHAAPDADSGGEPPRFDIRVARLQGVRLASSQPEPEPQPQPEPAAASAAEAASIAEAASTAEATSTASA